MPRFFVDDGAFSETDGVITVSITGADARHIAKSLRLLPGEPITVCDGSGTVYRCRAASVSDDLVAAEVVSVTPSGEASSEPPYFATVYQCMPKGDKLETVVMKAVECGAHRIVPVLSERCVARPDSAAAAKRTERLRRIAREAAGQSGRSRQPEVAGMLPFTDAVSEACSAELALLFTVGGGTVRLRDALEAAPFTPGMKIALMIGPEGGFSESETAFARSAGIIPCGLGARVLRTETAAQFALACLSYEYET